MGENTVKLKINLSVDAPIVGYDGLVIAHLATGCGINAKDPPGLRDNQTVWQLGAAANFDDLVQFGDRRQIRRSQMFMKLAFELGCDVI